MCAGHPSYGAQNGHEQWPISKNGHEQWPISQRMAANNGLLHDVKYRSRGVDPERNGEEQRRCKAKLQGTLGDRLGQGALVGLCDHSAYFEAAAALLKATAAGIALLPEGSQLFTTSTPSIKNFARTSIEC